MKLQVQPLSLKVLATRVVVINRMDYSTHLTGATKDELDRLDKLAGRFKIQSSKLTIEALYNGKKMPLDDWEYFKECFGRGLPNHLSHQVLGIPRFPHYLKRLRVISS